MTLGVSTAVPSSSSPIVIMTGLVLEGNSPSVKHSTEIAISILKIKYHNFQIIAKSVSSGAKNRIVLRNVIKLYNMYICINM